MKIKGSLEQAVCILLVIAHTKGHAPVKSYTLSERLGLSDSYLKKIMRQLVVAGLVDSEAGKKGGFVLKRAPKNISLLDVFEAIESTAPVHRSAVQSGSFRSDDDISFADIQPGLSVFGLLNI